MSDNTWDGPAQAIIPFYPRLQATSVTNAVPPRPGVFALPRLPWTVGALAPVISSRTMQFHLSLHHAGYIETANRLLAERPELAGKSRLEVLQLTARNDPGSALARNVAKAWNHDFFWSSLSPAKQRPEGELRVALEREFGSYAEFAHTFAETAAEEVGSGWLWLVADNGGRPRIELTGNSKTPAACGERCLLAIDLWEHAYCFDHQNRRREYLDAVIDRRLNWKFARQMYTAPGQGPHDSAWSSGAN